ncbi:YajG family lipoprotein [Acidithiobacillus ferriphilus]|uniref:hypothetical protein n=1 Tax=Acidithiobacillus ferriphilus TaxID=1689834 RepID=UPI00232E7115|nr:hypothetical protein [Acidithiobacillus ferriphilus]WCE95292.1 hypothetical protein PJU76_13585 [Acidithiobacillus ferriphilus]
MPYKNLKMAAKLIAFAGAFALTGCAFVPDTVHNHYTPPTSVNRVPGAEHVSVSVTVTNEKTRHNKVSVTLDGYGIPMAGVYMHVARDFKHAIDDALVARGFTIGDGGAQVHVVIKHFYLPEHVHWTYESHTGHVSLEVRVMNTAYRQRIEISKFSSDGDSGLSSAFSADRSTATNALMSASVNRLTSRPAFIAAVMKAGGHPAGADVTAVLVARH